MYLLCHGRIRRAKRKRHPASYKPGASGWPWVVMVKGRSTSRIAIRPTGPYPTYYLISLDLVAVTFSSQYQLTREIRRNPLIFAEILLADSLGILGRSLDKPNEPAQNQDTGIRVIHLGKVPRALKTRERLLPAGSFSPPFGTVTYFLPRK